MRKFDAAVKQILAEVTARLQQGSQAEKDAAWFIQKWWRQELDAGRKPRYPRTKRVKGTVGSQKVDVRLPREVVKAAEVIDR